MIRGSLNDGGLKYARWDGTAWDIQIIDSRGGDDLCLAFDAFDNPAIAYTNEGVRLARWTGAGWDVKTVAFDATVESLAFGPDGNLGIAYLNE